MRVVNLALACVLGALPLQLDVAAAQPLPGRRAPADESVAPPPASEAGLRTGYQWEVGAWSLGGQVRLPLLPGFYIVPSGDVYLAGSAKRWQLNLDAAFRLGLYRGVYSGAGIGMAHGAAGSGGTRSGLNVFAGFAPYTLRPRFLRPYVEARWLLTQNRSPFHLIMGANVPLARW
jgi:hypothetical protein